MTAREAYDTDSVFRALVDEWVRERRCPQPLIDRCLDFDMNAAADCARWASDPALTPDADISRPSGEKGEDGSPCGPYPTAGIYGWFWYTQRLGARRTLAAELPWANVGERAYQPGSQDVCLKHATRLDAILWALDNWQPAPVSA